MATIDIVRDVLVENQDLDPEAITEDAVIEDLGIDSLETVEMVMELEEELDVELELEEKMNTIGELVDFIESKI